MPATSAMQTVSGNNKNTSYMNIESFINQKEFGQIVNRLQTIQNETQQNSFNLFTVSSYNSYLENFHSDVIALLLNPGERHNQSNLYLDLFLDFLGTGGVIFEKQNYLSAEVTREQGRIDIWIKDKVSKRSIIIENKINNASDQEDQLETYHGYATNSGFEVDAIVYLTLNGYKNAPLTELTELNTKFFNIAAFTNSQSDLYHGWLQKCYESSSDEGNRSFIFQYLKLLKHLSKIGMDRELKNEFYSVMSKGDGFTKAKTIAQLLAGLEEYRADLFATRVNNDYSPFRKIYRWKANHWLFENFNDHGIIFKIDIQFLSEGSARIDFWNPNQPEEVQKLNSSTKLKSLGLFDDFEYGGFGGGMFKVFSLGKFGNLQAVDNELYFFVKEMFNKLR